MKKIAVDFNIEVRCPQTGGNWVKTSMWYHEHVVDEDCANLVDSKRYENFAELFADCENKQIRNADAFYNLFKKPVIWINNVTNLSTIRLNKSNFSWFEVRKTIVPHPEWSLAYLAKELSAEDFVELCQANGWKVEIGG